MATIESRTPLEAAIPERLFTVADLAEFPSELPSGPIHYELDNGRLVAMSPTGDEHGEIEFNLAALLAEFKRQGLVRGRCGEVGIVLWRNPDRVVGADLAIFAAKGQAIRRSPEGYLESMPDIVVEIVSKNDTRAYVQRKVDDYLHAGVRLVWLIDPAKRKVVEHRTGVAAREFTDSDTLAAEDIVNGLRLAVADIFAE